MKRFTMLAIAAVATTIALPATAHADAGYEFQSPSGNIRCMMYTSVGADKPHALCEITDHTWAAPAQSIWGCPLAPTEISSGSTKANNPALPARLSTCPRATGRCSTSGNPVPPAPSRARASQPGSPAATPARVTSSGCRRNPTSWADRPHDVAPTDRRSRRAGVCGLFGTPPGAASHRDGGCGADNRAAALRRADMAPPGAECCWAPSVSGQGWDPGVLPAQDGGAGWA